MVSFRRKSVKVIKIYFLIIFFLLIFGAGIVVGRSKNKVRVVTTSAETNANYGTVADKEDSIPDWLGRDVNFRIFWDLWNTIQEEYIGRPVGETKLFYGALNGMVASLGDPYSVFLEPKVAEEFDEELQGRFEGIGAEIGIRNDVITVISPLPESPAETAGLRAKDIIVKIDSFSTENMDLNEAVNRIRGEKGTVVNLHIYRAKTNEFLDIAITRNTIKIVSVKLTQLTNEDYASLANKKISLIEVTNFNADTGERFREAVQKTLLANPDGIILDLRGNPGGYLDMAIDMADYWLEVGESVVSETFATGDNKIHLSANKPVFQNLRTVVLINEGSASGSEIVAGALQDHQAATLIGAQSFGKGSVQQLMELGDGSSVKLTIARWLTPDGHQIDGEGITPDIAVEMTGDDYNNELDPQLDRAIEYFVKGE